MTSANVSIKNQELPGRWRMMIAGNDITPAWAIQNRASGKLLNCGTPEEDLSFGQVSRAIQEAYQEELKQFRADTVLGGYGLNMDEFLNTPKKARRDAVYKELFNKIEKCNFSLELLIYGFEGGSRGRIFTVNNPGNMAGDSLEGYSAIGSGFWVAMTWLNSQHRLIYQTEAEVIYRLCEAKFLSESAADVGHDTYAAILDSEGQELLLNSKQVEGIRQIWETEGKPKVPDSAVQAIEEALKNPAGIRLSGHLTS